MTSPKDGEPTSAMVEAVAKALFEHEWSTSIKPTPVWGFDGSQAYWTEAAHIAVAAMVAASPPDQGRVETTKIEAEMALANWSKYDSLEPDYMEEIYQANKVASALRNLLAALANKDTAA